MAHQVELHRSPARCWRNKSLLEAKVLWLPTLRPVVQNEEVVGRFVLSQYGQALGLGPVFDRDRTKPAGLAVRGPLPVPVMELVGACPIVHRPGQDQEPVRYACEVP